MKFAREVHEVYQQAYAMATRSLTKAKKQGLPVCPVALNTLMEERMISYHLDLGVMDIPTNLIVGVTEGTEKSSLYSKDFFPVSVPKSKFADQWRDLYRQCFSEEGLPGHIRCYEYLGKFYVADGLKRVSVAKYHKAHMIKSQVIRIMPIRTESKSIQQYYEFLFHFRLTRLYQIQFTQQGYFEKFQAALGYEPTYKWTDADRSQFLAVWPKIEYAFYKSYDEYLYITAADALVVLLEKYPYEQITQMESWTLARIFQTFWKEFYALSFPDFKLGRKQHKSAEALQTA